LLSGGYEVVVIVMPPRLFCSRVTRTFSVGDFDSMQIRLGQYSIVATYRSG